MAKISVFIDGGNFFDGLHAQGFSVDLNYRKLLALLADTEIENIGDVFFYIAPYPEGPYPNKCSSQEVYFQLLANQNIKVVRGTTEVRDGIFIERDVEAALATDLVAHAFSNHFDEALVISRRAAFAPAVIAAKQAGRTVKNAFFNYAFDPSNGLEGVASSSRIILSKDIIACTQSGPIPRGVHALSED